MVPARWFRRLGRGAARTGIRLAELVATMPLGTDLGLGQPWSVHPQTPIALRMGERLGVEEPEREVVYYPGRLAWVGCYVDAYEQARWFVANVLNSYYATAAPLITRRFGGEVEKLMGDGIMATFNSRGDEPDHAVRAAGAALALQRELTALAEAKPAMPQLRVKGKQQAVDAYLLHALPRSGRAGAGRPGRYGWCSSWPPRCSIPGRADPSSPAMAGPITNDESENMAAKIASASAGARQVSNRR